MKINAYLLFMGSTLSFAVFAAEKTQLNADQLLPVEEAYTGVTRTVSSQPPPGIDKLKPMRERVLNVSLTEYPYNIKPSQS